jgi:predicted DNA-binding transcriptional regulator AlpA
LELSVNDFFQEVICMSSHYVSAAHNSVRPLDQLLRVSQVAKHLGVSTRTVWRMRDQQIIPPPVLIGSMTRWRRSDISTYIQRGGL